MKNTLNVSQCTSCGGNNIGLRTDKRGVAEYYCEDCGKGLGKASSADLVGLVVKLEELIEDNAPKRITIAEHVKPKCKYCTEQYYYRQGRLGTVYVQVEHKFCPMCGRPFDKEKDRGV